MKFKKFIKIATFSALVFSLAACTQNSENSFRNNLDLGFYNGMHISWISDDSNSQATGFYVIDDINIQKDNQNNPDLKPQELIGHYKNNDIFWIKDSSNSKSKGFYLFKNSDGKVIPSISIGEKFKSGKHSTVKNVGVIFESALQNKSLNLKINENADEKTIAVNELSSEQLIKLSQRLLEIAVAKNDNKLNNQNIVSLKNNIAKSLYKN